MAKLTEDIAGSTKEVEALTEEAQKVKVLLTDMQSQLSSKV